MVHMVGGGGDCGGCIQNYPPRMHNDANAILLCTIPDSVAFFFFSNAFFKKRFASLKFPNVTFLSLLGNPCCKSELVDDSGDAVKAYRDQLVTALPQLGWIDSVVTVADRFTAGR